MEPDENTGLLNETSSLVNGGTPEVRNGAEDSESIIQTAQRKWTIFYNDLDEATKKTFLVTSILTFISVCLGSFFSNLFFVVLSAYLAHRLFKNQILKRGSDELDRTTAYSFVGKGFKATIYRLLSSMLLGFLLVGVPVMMVLSKNPAWLQEISEIGKEISSHGELVDTKALMQQGVSKARCMLESPKSAVLQTSSRLLVQKHARARGYMQYITDNTDDEFELPTLLFEDGTNALPLIGELLVALSNIPTGLLLYCGIMSAFIVNALTREFVKFWITKREALPSSNSTFQSVVASGMAVALGMAIIEYFVLMTEKGAFFGSVFFWIDAVFQMSTAAIIAMNLYHNSEVIFTDEKKITLLEPVIYRGLAGFGSFIIGIGVVKIVFPELGLLLQKAVGRVEDCAFMIPMVLLGLTVYIFEICLVIYVVKKAIRRFNERAGGRVQETNTV